jgi:hypothetical protein
VKLRENCGERKLQYRVFGAQNISLEFVEAHPRHCSVDRAGAGIEQPDVTQPHGEMFVDGMAHFSEPVGVRKNFD